MNQQTTNKNQKFTLKEENKILTTVIKITKNRIRAKELSEAEDLMRSI
jgi:hypothetical protein